MNTLLLALDLAGTFVFALAGATAGVRRQLDIFGLAVLSFATACNGGNGGRGRIRTTEKRIFSSVLCRQPRRVYRELAMPQFSETLLGLMGLSAGAYVAMKVPEATVPNKS